MFSPVFAALFFGLTVIDLHMLPQSLHISAQSAAPCAVCPHCGQSSSHIHSSYTRSPRDLPLSDYTVRLTLHVRRFRCANHACAAVTFAEHLGAYLPPYAQRTTRLRQALEQLGLALGGAAGARASKRLHMPASRNTLLRLVRHVPNPPVGSPRVLGIDDFVRPVPSKQGYTWG